MSSTKVKAKGLLKGFKYISHVFDEKEEDSIQIGFPTDVKHVAHIGWDGPSASAPTWMTEFKTNSNTEVSSKAEVVKSTETHEDEKDKTSKGSVVRKSKDIPKSRHISIDDQPNSPTKKSFDEKKHTRRHRSTDTSSENSTRESIGGTRHTRRHRHSKNEGELSSQDRVAMPKQTRRRKKNLSVDDDSMRSSASSMIDI